MWYFRVRDLSAPYAINVDPDMAHRDAMTIFINYKITDDHGRSLGATEVGLRVGAVKGLIESYQARYQRNIYFVDLAGQVVLHGSAFDPQAVGNIHLLIGISARAETIRDEIDREPVVYQWREIAISVSIGVTGNRPGENEDDLLQRVDQALYRAKQTGRNHVAGDSSES